MLVTCHMTGVTLILTTSDTNLALEIKIPINSQLFKGIWLLGECVPLREASEKRGEDT